MYALVCFDLLKDVLLQVEMVFSVFTNQHVYTDAIEPHNSLNVLVLFSSERR